MTVNDKLKAMYPLQFQCERCGERLSKIGPSDDPYARMASLIPEDIKSKQDTFSRDHLRQVCASIITGMGYNGYSKFMASLGLKYLHSSTYYDHCNQIYQLQNDEFQKYQEELVPFMRELYKTKAARDNKTFQLKDGCIPIMVSGDGSYPRRGFNSLECIYFILEAMTGIPIDVYVLRRCSKCIDREKMGTVCTSEGHFHGAASDMEQEAAQVLFNRSKQLGFYYETIICDGDSTSHNAIKNTYGLDSVAKGECIAHYYKRCKRHYDAALNDFKFSKFTKSGEEKLDRFNKELGERKGGMPNLQDYELSLNDFITEYPLREKKKV